MLYFPMYARPHRLGNFSAGAVFDNAFAIILKSRVPHRKHFLAEPPKWEVVVYSTLQVWIFTLIGTGVGAALGYFLYQHLHPTPRRNRELEEQLHALQEEHKHYRYDVNAHFDKTAELLTHLAASYREVHNHLARGTLDLCDTHAVRMLKMLPESAPVLEEQQPAMMEPPRDYALKSPYEKNVLAEDFGLEKKHHPHSITEPPRY